MGRHLAVLGLLILCFAFQSAGTYTQGQSPLANREHPRIWLTRSNIPEMRAKFAGDYRSEYQALVDRLNARMNRTSFSKWEDRWDLLNYAFVYALGSVDGINYGGQTIAAYGARARTLLNWFVAQGLNGNVQPELACAYDWLFPLLSPGERAAAVSVMAQGIAAIHYDEVNSGPWHSNVIRVRSEGAMAGIAFQGDGIDDGAASTLINTYLNKVQGPDGFMEANNFTSADGAWMTGLKYSINDSGGPAVLLAAMALEAWRTANGLTPGDVFGNANAAFIKNWSQWVLYRTTPFGVPSSVPGGRRYMLGVDHNMENGRQAAFFESGETTLAAHMLAGLYKNVDPRAAGLAQWLMDNRLGAPRVPGHDARYGVFSLLVAGQRDVRALGPTDLNLPLTKHFGGYGLVVMRTDWSDPSATQVTFTGSKWTTFNGSYEKYNSGSFTIDRNGPLAISSGQGGHSPYRVATWANNTLIFPDPNETSRSYPSDAGGQRRYYPDVKKKSDLAPGGPHDLGGVQRFLPIGSTAGQDFDYIFSDSTRAYNGDGKTYSDRYNTPKVRNFTRQLVYFRRGDASDTDRIVIFDRTETTSTRFEKRWLLHTSGNPTIDGSEGLVRHGKWRYAGASVVTQTNTEGGSNGTLFSTTLLPASRIIYKIGGPDSSGQWLTSGSHEFEDSYGVNQIDQGHYTQAEAQWVGQYRVEVVPATPQTQDNFLHVLEVGEASMSSRTPTALLNGTGMVGARVGDKIAAFSSTESIVTSGALVIDQPGRYWVLLCDLSPEVEYTLSSSVVQTASSAGTIYVEVSASAPNSRLSFQSGTAPARPPIPPSNVVLMQ